MLHYTGSGESAGDRDTDIVDTHASVYNMICLYWLNCTKFGQLILRNIIKIVATGCQILRLKCTRFNFGWGSAETPLVELNKAINSTD